MYSISKLLLAKGGCLARPGGDGAEAPSDPDRKAPLPGEATVAVLGLDGAGKSTVFASLRGEAVDEVLPTNGLDTDELRFGPRGKRGSDLTVLDLGGADKIRGIWAKYYAETHGFVFVVDATDPARFAEARWCLDKIRAHRYMAGKPFAVLANKCDVAGAAGPATVAAALRVSQGGQRGGGAAGNGVAPPPNENGAPSATGDAATRQGQEWHRVEGCAAIESTKRRPHPKILRAFRGLLAQVQREEASLGPRRRDDMADAKAENAKAREAKMARVAKIREERARKAAEAEAAAAAAVGSGGDDSPATGDQPADSTDTVAADSTTKATTGDTADASGGAPSRRHGSPPAVTAAADHDSQSGSQAAVAVLPPTGAPPSSTAAAHGGAVVAGEGDGGASAEALPAAAAVSSPPRWAAPPPPAEPAADHTADGNAAVPVVHRRPTGRARKNQVVPV